MDRFSAIDLSQLPAPDVIEPLDFETILAALVTDVTARFQAAGVDYDVGGLETDPVRIVLESAAYRELLMRARVNDAARAVLIAYAAGSDLDHLGSFYGVAREAGETDDRFRSRIQLAPEAFSTAGSAGAYIFHAMATDPSVAHAHAFTISPGAVTVVIAGASGEPVTDEVLQVVVTRLNRDDIRPLTDAVTVRKATSVSVDVTATLTLARGPDPVLIEAEARASVLAYLAGRYRIGADVHGSGVIAALTVAGVEKVALTDPSETVPIAETEIAVAGVLTITSEVL